jgi:hypothetical protein
MIRRIGSLALVMLASTALVLLTAEGLTRLLTDTHPSLTERDPDVGQRYLRDFAADVFVPESQRRVALRFNAEGFRGPTRERTKPSGTCRIAILGDSQIAAIATTEEDTLVARLERRLTEESPTSRWQVMNFGVSGASTAQELALYRSVVRDYDPDLVVCAFFEGNDLTDNSDRFSSNPRVYMDLDANGRLYTKPARSTLTKASIWLNRNSRFYVWQKVAFGKATARVRASSPALGVRGEDLVFSTEPSEDLDHAWSLTEKVLFQFGEEVRSDGRRFLLLYIPAAETLYRDLWTQKFSAPPYDLVHFDPRRAERRLRDAARGGRIDSLFLNEGFARFIAVRSGTDAEAWLYYGGNGHLNERGQALGAELLYRHLSTSGELRDLVGRCRPSPPLS